MNVFCVHPATSKCPQQLPNCLKRAETSVVLVAFNGVPITSPLILLPFPMFYKIVKLADAVTSIKQPPALKDHLLLVLS